MKHNFIVELSGVIKDAALFFCPLLLPVGIEKAHRKKYNYLEAGEREENIGCDLNDTAWFDKNDAQDGAVFYEAGVFYYFLTDQVKALVQKMAERFPGGKLVFDAAGKSAVKVMLKTWIKDAQIKDVGAYFAVADAKRQLSGWSPDITVSSRVYMLGYQSLDDPSLKRFYRLLAKIGDGMMKMRIVRIDFNENR